MSSKCTEEEFSTTDILESECRYSTRYKKQKNSRRSNCRINGEPLPYNIEKAATTIQRFWRLRLLMRRLYYKQLLQELINENNIHVCLIDKQRKFASAIRNQNDFRLAMIDRQKAQKCSSMHKKVKLLARECVAVTFKMEKKMLSATEIHKFQLEKQALKKKIDGLRLQKRQLEETRQMYNEEEDELILKEIKEANVCLSKIVEQKNVLKHLAREKMLETELI